MDSVEKNWVRQKHKNQGEHEPGKESSPLQIIRLPVQEEIPSTSTRFEWSRMAATNFGCSLCSAVISPELQSLLAFNPPVHWWGVKFNLRSGIRSTNYTRTQREGTHTLVRLSTLSATTAAHPNFRPCHVPSEQFGESSEARARKPYTCRI